MLSRREMLAGGMVGSLAAAPPPPEEQPSDREGQREIRQAIDRVQGSLDRAFNSLSLATGVIAALRTAFEQFLRANGKFPDYCDIGINVFFDVYDWHVRNRQQVTVTRTTDNRYLIQFMFTTLILRHENDRNFVGAPYDKA